MVGRLFLGAVALDVIAWHDGVAGLLCVCFLGRVFLVVDFWVLKMRCKGW